MTSTTAPNRSNYPKSNGPVTQRQRRFSKCVRDFLDRSFVLLGPLIKAIYSSGDPQISISRLILNSPGSTSWAVKTRPRYVSCFTQKFLSFLKAREGVFRWKRAGTGSFSIDVSFPFHRKKFVNSWRKGIKCFKCSSQHRTSVKVLGKKKLTRKHALSSSNNLRTYFSRVSKLIEDAGRIIDLKGVVHGADRRCVTHDGRHHQHLACHVYQYRRLHPDPHRMESRIRT